MGGDAQPHRSLLQSKCALGAGPKDRKPVGTLWHRCPVKPNKERSCGWKYTGDSVTPGCRRCPLRAACLRGPSDRGVTNSPSPPAAGRHLTQLRTGHCTARQMAVQGKVEREPAGSQGELYPARPPLPGLASSSPSALSLSLFSVLLLLIIIFFFS